MPTAIRNPTPRRGFVLDHFRVQGARTPHGNPQTTKELIPYCEEVVCEGLYTEVMDAVTRQDPALATIAGVSDEYLSWAVDMTMYYFVISSLKARGIVNSLDATGYFTFQFPKPGKWVLAEDAATTSTAAFGQWMAQREVAGGKVALGMQSANEEMEMMDCTMLAVEPSARNDEIDPVIEKLATSSQDDIDELVGFMKQVVL